MTTSPNRKHAIQVTGDARQLQGVKTDVNKFVESIDHKTVTFSTPGKYWAKVLTAGH